jgi:hypothetical protein
MRLYNDFDSGYLSVIGPGRREFEVEDPSAAVISSYSSAVRECLVAVANDMLMHVHLREH